MVRRPSGGNLHCRSRPPSYCGAGRRRRFQHVGRVWRNARQHVGRICRLARLLGSRLSQSRSSRWLSGWERSRRYGTECRAQRYNLPFGPTPRWNMPRRALAERGSIGRGRRDVPAHLVRIIPIQRRSDQIETSQILQLQLAEVRAADSWTFTNASGSAGWRSGRDSNPRYGFAVYSLSRRAPSTTRPPLRTCWKGAHLRVN
jgi:hypothetical protein